MLAVLKKNENPVGIDFVVSSIQDCFWGKRDNSSGVVGGVSWLDKIHGLAKAVKRRKENKYEKTAIIYCNKGEYDPLMFSDKTKSFCYFILNDPCRYSNKAGGAFSYNLSIVFTVNLKRINNAAAFDYHFEQHLIFDVFNILKNIKLGFDIAVEEIYSQDFDYIFKEYKATEIPDKLRIFPYANFRFELQITLPEQCLPPIEHKFLRHCP